MAKKGPSGKKVAIARERSELAVERVELSMRKCIEQVVDVSIAYITEGSCV